MSVVQPYRKSVSEHFLNQLICQKTCTLLAWGNNNLGEYKKWVKKITAKSSHLYRKS